MRSRTTRGHHSRRLAVISAALVVCGAVAILTVKAATSERATSAGRAAEVRGSRSPLLRGGAPSSALTERFSVFRLPRIAADDISQRAGGALVSQVFADQAHLAAKLAPLRGPGRATDTDLFIAGGPNDVVCLLALPPGADGPGGQCTSADAAAAGRSVVTNEQRSEVETEVDIYGVVPDGINRVTVTLDVGTTTVLPVSDNAYSATLPGAPATLSYNSRDGAVTVNASS